MKKPVKKLDKHIFVIESDEERSLEIKVALQHRITWKLSFFDSPEACLSAVALPPMVVFLDVEHFGSQSSDSKAVDVISRLKRNWNEVVVIVFSDSEREQIAADSLKAGALDYIILNQHKFARMESELTWIEKFLNQRSEDRKQKRFLLYVTFGFFIFVVIMMSLTYFGYLKEGNRPDILIGE